MKPQQDKIQPPFWACKVVALRVLARTLTHYLVLVFVRIIGRTRRSWWSSQLVCGAVGLSVGQCRHSSSPSVSVECGRCALVSCDAHSAALRSSLIKTSCNAPSIQFPFSSRFIQKFLSLSIRRFVMCWSVVCRLEGWTKKNQKG